MRWLRTRTRTQRLLLLAAALLLGLCGFLYGWIFADLPSIGNIEAGLTLPATRIYDRHGRLLYDILPPQQGRSTPVTLDEVPVHCINAVIATEDANYWSHPGVDITGILRALWINLQGGEVLAGGSTITQQTARLLLLDPAQRAERTLQRKLKEAVLAVQMQNAYSKEHVLTLYLNQAYFGNLAYGIEAAARAYFHKSAAELSLAECALLAGILQNAVQHDPLSNLEGARARQEVALGLMVQNGYITEAEAETARREPLRFGATPFPIQAPHFVMAVWKQLERTFPEQLYGGGLEVLTTVDLDWQRTAEQIVRARLERINNPSDGRAPASANNAAVVAIDPYTGQVLTMLGSPDYFNEQISGAVNAALAPRQPGSALKPFTYAAAMDPTLPAPYTAATMILDVHTPFVTRRLESYAPANYGLVEHGPVLVREALASSYNIPAVVALDYVGIPAFLRLASSAGLHELARNTAVDLSITLGGGEVRLLDLVQAYSIFPNGGFYIEPSMILRVSTQGGQVLYEWQPPELSTRVLDERVAYLITDILSDNNARLPSFGPSSPLLIGRPAAAKTGTTTDFRDNWVVGYTPNLVVGVWVGNADNTPMVDVTGVSGAGPIWNLFMQRVLRGQPRLDFERPPGLVQVEVCALSGLLPTPQCALRRREWFIPGTEPQDYDHFYQVFEVDMRSGLLADDSTPPEYRRPETYIVLPPEALSWALRNGIRQPPPEAAARLPDSAGLRLISPDPYTIFEISPIIPREFQRLRLAAGVSPGTQSVSYYLNGELLGRVDAAPWALWWALEIGRYTLVAEALLEDGSTETSAPLPFTVVDYDPYAR